MTVTWRPRSRPTWVERYNAHALHIGDPASTLHPDELVATARARTGLDDAGDDGWRRHYDVLLDAIDREARLHPLGAMMTRTDILRALENRLELHDLWRRRPEILGIAVDEPVFIVGPARSGTSILHELLGLDPDHATPTSWMVHHPVAAAEGDAAAVARAREASDRVVRFWHDVAPEYESMHHNHGELPTECIFLTVPMFLSDNWSGTHTVPTYALHLATADHAPAYRWHRRMLQTLSVRRPDRRWVCKAPSHLATLRTLFAEYPDARVIQLHRDPARTLASMFDLMGTLAWMRTDHVDLEGFVGAATAGLAHVQARVTRDRADGTLPDGRFHDLHYLDLLRDPVAAIGDLHDHFGWSFDDHRANAVQRYLADRPQNAHGVHRYDLADFGLTAEEVRSRFAESIERFGVRLEN